MNSPSGRGRHVAIRWASRHGRRWARRRPLRLRCGAKDSARTSCPSPSVSGLGGMLRSFRSTSFDVCSRRNDPCGTGGTWWRHGGIVDSTMGAHHNIFTTVAAKIATADAWTIMGCQLIVVFWLAHAWRCCGMALQNSPRPPRAVPARHTRRGWRESSGAARSGAQRWPVRGDPPAPAL